MIPKNQRIWLAVLIVLAVVILNGAWIFSTVATPAVRPFDYGTVPFVPAASRYSSHRPPVVPLPNPAATRPPPGGGTAR